MRNYLKRMDKKIEGKPDASEFPRNLFSMLEGTHEIYALENMTQFAPSNEEIADYIPPPASASQYSSKTSGLFTVT